MRPGAAAAVVCTAALMWSGEEVSISLCDFDRLRPAALATAKDEAERVFRSAGVSVRWNGCTGGPPRDNGAGFVVRLRTDTLPSARNLATFSALGGALLDSQHSGLAAEAYWLGIGETARWQRIDAPTLLGFVIAHEVGHLILGERHSSAGLMRGAWDRKALRELSRGWLKFSNQDAARMRGEVRARRGTNSGA